MTMMMTLPPSRECFPKAVCKKPPGNGDMSLQRNLKSCSLHGTDRSDSGGHCTARRWVLPEKEIKFGILFGCHRL